MRKSASVVNLILACTALFVAASVSPAGADVYPQKQWTFRAKPEILRESILFHGGLIVMESSDDRLYFIDKDTGAMKWVFGFFGPVSLYVIDDNTIIVLCGRTLHRMDIAERRKAWSIGLKNPAFEELLVSDDKKQLAVRYDKKTHDVFSLERGGRPAIARALEGAFEPVRPSAAPPFRPDVLGEGSSLSIEYLKAVFRPAGGGQGWTFNSDLPLAPTAAAFSVKKGMIALVDSAGTVSFVSARSGEMKSQIKLPELIDMRFWDERPENIDNYSNAALFTEGDFLYVVGPSNMTKIKLSLFPDEISLKKSGESGDSTLNWSLERAIKQWDEKNYAQATQLFMEIVTTWPDNPQGHLFLGMAYSSTGHIDEAIAELEKAHQLDPENPDIASNLAGNYMLKIFELDPVTQFAEIIATYNKILGLQPTSAYAYTGLVEIYLGRREFDKAVAVIEDSFRYTFRGPGLYSLLLAAYYMDDRHDDVLPLSDAVIRLFPDSDIPFILKAKTLCKLGRYKEAASAFESAPPRNDRDEVSVYPRLLATGARFFHGNAVGLSGRYKEGAGIMLDYVASLPTPEQVAKVREYENKRMESAKAGDGNEPEIEESLKGKTYLELNSELEFKIPALLSLAHFQYRMGDNKKSVATLRRIRSLGAGDAETLSYAGYIYALNGADMKAAKDYVEAALELDSEDPIYLRNYAVYLSRAKQYARAEEMFKKAIGINDAAELLRFEYGTMLLETGRLEEAAEQFRAELKLTPDLAMARKALQDTDAKQKTKQGKKK